MAIKDRLKRLELNQPAKPKVTVVRFSADIEELSYGGEKFQRNYAETERDFIKRVKAIVMDRPRKQNPTILVGNF